jgi:hypothetical protein
VAAAARGKVIAYAESGSVPVPSERSTSVPGSSTEMTALAFDVGFILNIRHSFDSSARQFRAISRHNLTYSITSSASPSLRGLEVEDQFDFHGLDDW